MAWLPFQKVICCQFNVNVLRLQEVEIETNFDVNLLKLHGFQLELENNSVKSRAGIHMSEDNIQHH